VIHLVGIIMEHRRRGVTFDRVHVEGTRNMLDAVRGSQARRFVHMSALGTRKGAVARYHQTKWDAETLVRASGLDFTIFRPSLIHGPGGEFTKMLADWSRMRRPPWLFMPYFGRGLLGFGGSGLLQPIHVDDVARAFVDAIDNTTETSRTSIGQTIDLAGPERLTWPELHRTASRAIIGRRRLVLPLPAWWARVLTSIVPEQLLGTNRSQVDMSQEDNTADFEAVVRSIGFRPRDFTNSISQYAGSL
jgi:NADH dehydrogenase